MGQQLLHSLPLGVILVLTSLSGARSQEDIPMRMADESLVVANYRPVDAPPAGQSSTVTVSPDDSTEYQIYQGVMGRPGIDFPVHPHIPATAFSCRDIKRSGYYADLETDCQVFHICDGGRKISFLCPNGTIFRQSHLICDWWFRVDCGKSVELYEESAEQLAADQKVYKARSDERERRKQTLKAKLGEPDIYALDEPYRPSSAANRQSTSSERKGERNSKRVMDAKFSDMYPGRQGKSLDGVSERAGKLSGANDRRSTLNPSPTPPQATVFTPKTRFVVRTNDNRLDNFQRAASSSLVSGFNQHIFAVDKNLFSTAKPKYVEPTTTTTTISVPKREQERQHFAESASFASHRGGRTFSDFQNPNYLQSNFPSTFVTSTTPKYTTAPYKIVNRGTSKSIEIASAFSDKTYKQKKAEERLKFAPFVSASPIYKPTVPLVKTPSTTPYTTPYTSASSRIPVDNVYFTTLRPETDSTTKFESGKVNVSAHDIAISLQELNIHKGTTETPTAKTFEDVKRDGLEVPPSSGPTALRSFALYFAGSDDDDQTGKDLPFVSKNVLIIPIRKNAGRRVTAQPSVVQQVEQIVKESQNVSTTSTLAPPAPSVDSLPSSLTTQTKDSYNNLFSGAVQNETNDEKTDSPTPATEAEVGTTVFDSFTELPVKINSALVGNDLQSSQSRGILEPELKTNQISDTGKVAVDLRELAQVFTKALSAYLDDPEAFRRVLAEIRPTEPAPSAEEISSSPLEYPSATQEEDEVLDFSDVTKPPNKKKPTTEINRETTTAEIFIETTTNLPSDASNLVLPLSSGLNTSETRYRIPDIELSAPLYESLDQSQSSYYTPTPNLVGTTNAIAEEINKEFSPADKLPEIDSNEAIDSYFPISGSVDDKSRPRYGGFQNNSRSHYSPYGAELTTIPPFDDRVTTFKPKNRTSALFSRLKLEEAAASKSFDGTRSSKQINNPSVLPLSINSGDLRSYNLVSTTRSPQTEFQSINLGNGETVERVLPKQRSNTYLTTTEKTEEQETNPEEINLELSPPFETESPKGFLVTYTLVNGEYQTYKPQTTTVMDELTTVTTESFAASTDRALTQVDQTETYLPTTIAEFYAKTTRDYPSLTTTTEPTPTTIRFRVGKSMERLMELQEELMFNTTQLSEKEKEEAREMVKETMSNVTMSDMTATTLTKMMELAARNETYRRLVLLLVNDRSGRNKTVEEARLSLLRALLTPVITQGRPRGTTSTSTTTEVNRFRGNFRRGKNLFSPPTATVTTTERPRTTVMRVTTAGPGKSYRKTTVRPRIVKTTEAPTTTTTTEATTTSTTTEKPSTVIGNLGLIRQTIENSKTKEIRINSLDDAILDSDSRAIELLRSLYSLAARWG